MFKSARIKLTAWYLLIIIFISIFFSLGIYKVLTLEVERFARIQQYRLEREPRGLRMPPPPGVELNYPIYDEYSTQLVNELKRRIIFNLGVTNLVILSISAVLGYFLSGKTLKPIQNMVDEQNRFITDASHELRTPLTALKSSMEVFLRDTKANLNDAQILIKESISDVDSLTDLSDALLQLAQYEKINGTQGYENISVSLVAQDVVNKILPLANKRNIEIATDVDNFDIWASKKGISDLLNILIDNAIKYSPENTKITLVIKKDNGKAIIQVRDEGVGIDQKEIHHIFDRFYRADKSRSDSHTHGYGLGLSIAKRIVDNHKGNINVESTINKGSTFTVRLPVDHKNEHV